MCLHLSLCVRVCVCVSNVITLTYMCFQATLLICMSARLWFNKSDSLKTSLKSPDMVKQHP